MKKRIVLLTLLSSILFSCKHQRTYQLLPDEVESILINNDINYVKVGDVVNIDSYVRFEKAYTDSYTISLTKNSLNYAILNQTNSHVVEFLKEGNVFVTITTDNEKVATLKFCVQSQLKMDFLNYIANIDKNYAFLEVETVEKEEGSTTSYEYKTIDDNGTINSNGFRNIHNSNYFLYNFQYDTTDATTLKNYNGFIKDVSNNETYQFDGNSFDEKIKILPGDLGNEFEDYLFSSSYYISQDIISTYEEENKEYLKIDLSSDVSLATSILTGPLSLSARKKTPETIGSSTYIIEQGDHINIEFKDVQYINTKGEKVIRNLPIYAVYNKKYTDGNYEGGEDVFKGYFALVSNEDDIKVEIIEKTIEDFKTPSPLIDNTLSSILETVLEYNNYSLTIQGLWYGEDGYAIPKDDIPKLSGNNLFDNFYSVSYFTENIIKDQIIYGYSYIYPTYVYRLQSGDNSYTGTYKEDSSTYSLTYYIDGNNKHKLQIKNASTGLLIEKETRYEKIDENSFYLYYTDSSDEEIKLKFVNSDYIGIYSVYKDENLLTTLTYQGNGVGIYDNVKDDDSLSSSLINRGFYVDKDGNYITSVFDIKNPLQDFYDNYVNKVELQKVSTISLSSSSTYKKALKIDISKIDSTEDLFISLLESYPQKGKSMSEYFKKTRTNINGAKFNFTSYFSPSIIAYYTNESDTVPNRIAVEFGLTYSSTESIYYSIGFYFQNFGGIKL